MMDVASDPVVVGFHNFHRPFPATFSELFWSVWGTGMRNQKIQGREQNVKTFPDMKSYYICWPEMAEGDNSAESWHFPWVVWLPSHPTHPLLVPNPKYFYGESAGAPILSP